MIYYRLQISTLNKICSFLLQNYKDEAQKQRKIIFQLEKERDRYINEAGELTQKVLQHMEDVKVREMQIFDYKKKIAEAETKLKQQQVRTIVVASLTSFCNIFVNWWYFITQIGIELAGFSPFHFFGNVVLGIYLSSSECILTCGRDSGSPMARLAPFLENRDFESHCGLLMSSQNS